MGSLGRMLSPGVRLGRYEVVRLLAIGGMAEVYLARACGADGWKKLCALKRLNPDHLDRRDFMQMFHDEARLAAYLQHQNVAQVYDMGTANETPFFTMEYVHGESVQKIVAASRHTGRDVPVDQAVTIILGVLAGIHHAHEKVGPDGAPLHIVHRDVSGANVVVAYDGGVKVIDFGVAKACHRETKSLAGTLKGKVAYMSPEQVRGDAIDRRSDVFSSGVLLYELVCGSRPFQAENDYALLTKIVNDEYPPPSAYRRGLSPTLERIIQRALARDPADRYPTAQEMQLELEALAREQRFLVSPVALASFMEQLFGKKPDPSVELDSPADAGASSNMVSISMVIDVDGLPPRPALERRRRLITGAAAAVASLALLLLGGWLFGPATTPAAPSPSPAAMTPAAISAPGPLPAPSTAPAPPPVARERARPATVPRGAKRQF